MLDQLAFLHRASTAVRAPGASAKVAPVQEGDDPWTGGEEEEELGRVW